MKNFEIRFSLNLYIIEGSEKDFTFILKNKFGL